MEKERERDKVGQTETNRDRVGDIKRRDREGKKERE